MRTDTQTSLLMSGGIGDFLHYIVRFSSFLIRSNVTLSRLRVFVESTNPRQVESLFQTCLPEVQCHFVPPNLHWTKTNPLLNVNRQRDRVNRPAYRYVLQNGAAKVEDWFLPFLCRDYPVDPARLNCLLDNRSAGDEQTVFVSTRDKGFLWWPSRESFLLLAELIPPRYRVIYVGTPDERLPWLDEFTSAPSVLEALKLSCAATLFVGTDTGFATARELLGMPNIYCVNEYWYEELMVKYSYWTEQMNEASGSRFAFDTTQLRAALALFFARQPQGLP